MVRFCAATPSAMLRVAGVTEKSPGFVPVSAWLVTFNVAVPVSLTAKAVLTGEPIAAVPTLIIPPEGVAEP